MSVWLVCVSQLETRIMNGYMKDVSTALEAKLLNEGKPKSTARDGC